ncbi:hypothetical protein MMC07_005856 [Pseudocyphellaria aurata]|nr:hypothetical protein [Pseudocyphellaria aurata]
MQFKSIIAGLSFAMLATAVPTNPTTVCKAGNTAVACSKDSSAGLLAKLLGQATLILPITAAITTGPLLSCFDISVIPILSGNQQAANACCPSNSVTQTGLVNANTQCTPIII